MKSSWLVGLWSHFNSHEACKGLLWSGGELRSCDAVADSWKKSATGQWSVHRWLGAYRNLDQHLPKHIAWYHIFVHTDKSLDPVTRVHTQEAESAWANLKGPLKGRRSFSHDDLQAYLEDRMWRQWQRLDRTIANILLVLSLQYRDYIVYYILNYWSWGKQLCFPENVDVSQDEVRGRVEGETKLFPKGSVIKYFVI